MSNASGAAAPARVTPPRTINLASLALVLEAAAWVGAALALKASTTAYTNYYFAHATKNDKAKSHYSRSNAADVKAVADHVSSDQRGLLSQAILGAVILLLLAYLLRRTRGASPARWSVVIISVLMQTPFGVIAVTSKLPAGFRIGEFVLGVLSIVAIVLLFVPQSRAYFREVRASITASMPARPGGRGGGGLFGRMMQPPPPRTAETKPARRGATGGVDLAKKDVDQPTPAKPAVQEKKRADAAAVAKGAAMARNRAKAAGKSRRMED